MWGNGDRPISYLGGNGMEDVVVIGAGLSGLTAARQLHRSGYRVLVVDKSRGLGGRLATRRLTRPLGTTVIDHGCRYLEPFNDAFLSPIATLLAEGVLQPWQPETFSLAAAGSLTSTNPGTLYVAPQGISAVAKAIAPGLTIARQWRASTLTPTPQGWCIAGESLGAGGQGSSKSDQPNSIEARAVVVAIPAPQVAALIEAAAQQHGELREMQQQLETVAFEAVITAIAGYSPDQSPRLSAQNTPGGWLVTGNHHPTLRWVALDSSKRTDSKEPVVVVHSSAAFAASNIDRSDLEQVGKDLMESAAENLDPWLKTPDWMQVHRWRYGFVSKPLNSPLLSSSALPNLVGCGDWCGGGNAEGAIASGHQAARLIAQALA